MANMEDYAVRYEPPAEVTAGLARLVWNGGYDVRVFAAALVTLAAKGWMSIDQREDQLVLLPNQSGDPLLERERHLLERLFRAREALPLEGDTYLDLKGAQSAHFDALMDEDDAFFSAPMMGSAIAARLAGWFWPVEARKTQKLLRQIGGYRRYLGMAMAARLDPVFLPGQTLNELCFAMPYIVAFDIRNSWADAFVDCLAALVDHQPATTSLHDLGDMALKRKRRQQAYLKSTQGERLKPWG